MKILFIGGTGRLSCDVAKLSLAQGNEVYLLTRGSQNRKIFADKNYHMIYGNIRKPDVCKELLKDMYFDVIIDFLTFNVEQLKSVLDIIDKKYHQYIFISSATVYDVQSQDELISESNTPIGNDKWKYSYNKFLCEEYLNKHFQGKEEKYTIVRPYVTYGDTRVPYPLVPRKTTEEYTIVDRIIRGKPIPTFNNGSTITTLTHTRDFAIGVAGLYMNEMAYGNAFHVSNDETTTWGTVLDTLGTLLGTSVNKMDFGIPAISKILPEYEEILLGDKGRNMKFDNSKLKAAVPNYTCNISLSDGLQDMLNFYNNNPDMKIINYTWNGRIDRLCNSKSSNDFDNFKQRIDYFIGYHTLIFKLHKAFSSFSSRILSVLRKIKGKK